MAGPSAKAPRLRSLTHLIGTFEKPRQDFVQKLIPEAVLCCTESTAVRARQAALLFLSKATEKMILWNHPDKTKSQVLAELLEFLCAGFAGSTASIISAIAAITHLLKEHTAFFEQTTRGKLFEMSLVLLQSSNRQVLTHVLALSKLLLKKSSIRDFGNFTRELASILGKFPELEKKACRKTIRLILVIALKNLGIEILHKMVPDCFKKVVMNLHKKNLKKASKPPKDDIESDEEDETPRLKAESFEDMLGDDSDVETAEEDKKKQRPRLKAKRTKGKEAWLEERGKEEEIVDLLDPSAAQKVIATKPNNPATNKSGIKHDFKMAADGKMIITDGEQPVAKKQEVKLEMNELLDALEGAASVGKKRKVRVREADDSDEEVETSPKKYTAGGKGIHRPTGIEMGGEYRSKKARGDMKRKGKQDPYAYIPLDAKSLNKRKVKKLQGRFKNVVGAAKKGAMKGKKLKAKNKKK
jgi:ribosomal RNA-processing protein 12